MWSGGRIFTGTCWRQTPLKQSTFAQLLKDAKAWNAFRGMGVSAHKGVLAPVLWERFEDAGGDPAERNRALDFLLAYDADSPRWDKVRAEVARLLTHESRPVSALRVPAAVVEQISDNLLGILDNADESETARTQAMAILFQSARDKPDVIAGILRMRGPGARAALARALIEDPSVTFDGTGYVTTFAGGAGSKVSLTPLIELVVDNLREILESAGESRTARVKAMRLLAEISRDKPHLIMAILCSGVRLGDVQVNRETAGAALQPETSSAMVRALAHFHELDPKPSTEQLDGLLDQELRRVVSPTAGEAEKDALARKQALAAVVLIYLGQAAKVAPLLRHSSDPQLRSYIIDRAPSYLVTAPVLAGDANPPKPTGKATWEVLLDAITKEQEASIRRALILCLGRGASDRDRAHGGALARAYNEDPDAGIHSALKFAGISAAEVTVSGTVARPQPTEGKSWYVRSNHTFSVVRGPVEFDMGSPTHEKGRFANEDLHRRRIPRSFAISTMEVTGYQFQSFLRANPAILREYLLSTGTASYSNTGATFVTWYMAAQYCRWLSEQERVPEEQMCYPRIGDIKEGMKLPEDYLSRTGYRLPTEAEWEYACRAGAVTSRSYGSSEELLHKYAVYSRQASSSYSYYATSSSCLPNDLGLFDMLGNAAEWCQDRLAPYPQLGMGEVSEDREDTATVADADQRVLRGGSSASRPEELRCAFRTGAAPSSRQGTAGFRLARTVR